MTTQSSSARRITPTRGLTGHTEGGTLRTQKSLPTSSTSPMSKISWLGNVSCVLWPFGITA